MNSPLHPGRKLLYTSPFQELTPDTGYPNQGVWDVKKATDLPQVSSSISSQCLGGKNGAGQDAKALLVGRASPNIGVVANPATCKALTD